MDVVDNEESFTDLGLKYVGNVDFFKTDNYVGLQTQPMLCVRLFEMGLTRRPTRCFRAGSVALMMFRCEFEPIVDRRVPTEFGLGTLMSTVRGRWSLRTTCRIRMPTFYVEVQDGWFNFETTTRIRHLSSSPSTGTFAVQNARVGTVTFEGSEALPRVFRPILRS
ncbi:MAG: hypothetical protein H6512_08535 [Acidimicrobiia bacterium]|nr:hypothetical protein [Acidimicrobiia bacterium]